MMVAGMIEAFHPGKTPTTGWMIAAARAVVAHGNP